MLSPACRLRSGRFDRLPTLESLFFCWPKRKVTQRKWPLRAKARSDKWNTSADDQRSVGGSRDLPLTRRLHRKASKRRGLKAGVSALASVVAKWNVALSTEAE